LEGSDEKKEGTCFVGTSAVLGWKKKRKTGSSRRTLRRSSNLRGAGLKESLQRNGDADLKGEKKKTKRRSKTLNGKKRDRQRLFRKERFWGIRLEKKQSRGSPGNITPELMGAPRKKKEAKRSRKKESRGRVPFWLIGNHTKAERKKAERSIYLSRSLSVSMLPKRFGAGPQ